MNKEIPTTEIPDNAEQLPSAYLFDSGPANDSERAARFVEEFQTDLRYVSEWSAWMNWNGTHWQRDNGEVMRKAEQMPGVLLRESSQIKDLEKQRRAAAAAVKAGDAHNLRAMLSLAQSKVGIAAASKLFDANPYLVGVKNGCVDLRKGEFHYGQREDFVTRKLGTEFDASATCPLWEKFIARVLDNDSETIAYVQRALGYSLTGDVSEQCLFFLHGEGKNGKSTFIETVQALFGGYAHKADNGLFTLDAKKAQAPLNEIARLKGQRLITSAETEEGCYLAESRVKDLTGGDTLTGRFLYCEPFNFRPTHKLWIYGNHKPNIRGSDLGIWRRIRLVPFDVIIPAEERDGQLGVKLLTELSGILNWAIKGCLDWQKQELAEPKKVSGATEEYREEEDLLGEFIAELCHTGLPGNVGRVERGLLYTTYQQWAHTRGNKPMSDRTFGKRLRGRPGIGESRPNGVRCWTGITLKPDVTLVA